METDEGAMIKVEPSCNNHFDSIETVDHQQQQTNSNGNNNIDLDNSNYNHQCYICDKVFSANSNLNRHLRKIHKENVQSPYNNVKCALCDSVYPSSSIYNRHLDNDHKVKIEIERKTFADKKSFDDWKHSVENQTTSQFIKSRGEKKTKNVNKTYYSCNRSGYYVSKARTQKALKKQGSRKINGRCPASMNVTVNPDFTYEVRFVKTHVGHSFELKHLDLSDQDREIIVQKLVSGVTKKDIIKQLRSAAEQLNPITASVSPTSTISPSGAQPVNADTSTIANDSETTGTTANELIFSSVSETPTSSVNANPIGNSSTTAVQGASNCNILNNLNNQQQQTTSRLHLATTKDIHNIINAKNLDSKRIRHNYDLNNVEAWISEMKEFNEASSVLFYKSQSELIDRFPSLREDDFMLIIMKDGQSEVFKKYGERCIIIDSTHNIHCEYLQVATVSVIDQDGKCFPVAFLFSSRTDCEVLEVFFTILKDKVGTITTRMVIADELNDFYQAWTNIMTRPTHNLLTPWSVFDNWAKKFDLILNREKLRKLKKSLRALLTESETDKFARSLTQIIEEHKHDPEVSEFLKYFEEKFAKNPDLWSSCLRKTHGASNFQLWRLHDKFKVVYKEGKNSKKLCKYVAKLMSLFEDSQLERLSEIEDGNPAKQKALLDRHKKSVGTSSLVYEVAVEPAYWLCPSESSNEVYYEVKHENKVDGEANVENPPDLGDLGEQDEAERIRREEKGEKGEAKKNVGDKCKSPKTNCCDLKCPTCAACRHQYKCTCLDYIVNLNMCKHIHRICAMRRSQTEQQPE